MLVLSRKAGESVLIGHEIEVTVVRISGKQVRLKIEAPRTVPVLREELREQEFLLDLEDYLGEEDFLGEPQIQG